MEFRDTHIKLKHLKTYLKTNVEPLAGLSIWYVGNLPDALLCLDLYVIGSRTWLAY